MAPDGELRLFAVPMCGGLVYAGAKALVLGPSAAALFSGFLFGSVIAIVLGIPLLLWGDRRCPGSRLRHLLSALLQSLAANLLLGLPVVTLLWSTLAGGLALGLLSSLVLLGIERLPGRTPAHRRSPASVIAVPLSGGLTLGLAASVFIEHSLGAFCLFFLIGGLLGMLVCWPVLWLVERRLNTSWRYLVGGVISSGLIWLMSALPHFLDYARASVPADYPWPSRFGQGALLFLALGLVAGGLCTALNALFAWLWRRKGQVQP
jgi:tetrahydromethanopterin S-methyltransferase subunit F